MNWLNIDVTALRSPEFIGAEPIARATWLCLLGYCADQENGGVIADCEQWGDRRWMQTCAVTRAEIDASKPLAFWVSSALHVAFYPIEQEERTKANRTNGLKGGRPKVKSELEPVAKPSENQLVNHVVQSGVNVKERKGKERKEKECKEIPIVFPFDSELFKQAWSDFEEHRKAKKAKLTHRAVRLVLKDLPKNEADAIACLEQSIKNGWTAVYPVKKENQSSFANQKPSTHLEGNDTYLKQKGLK